MERELAERVFFEAARDIRDAWLTWPARIAPLLAAELGVDARTLNAKLVEYVNQHPTELGTPDADRVSRPLS